MSGKRGKSAPRGELAFSVTLDDCEIQTFAAGGPGGQHQNHNNTAVRIVHRASGAAGTAREERSQLLNKRKAFERMAANPVFQAWIHEQLHGKKEPPEALVAKDMDERNMVIMVKQFGEWTLEQRGIPAEEYDEEMTREGSSD